MKPRDGQEAVRIPEEVKQVLYQCLRLRGLLYVADKVFENEPFGSCREQPFSADYNATDTTSHESASVLERMVQLKPSCTRG